MRKAVTILITLAAGVTLGLNVHTYNGLNTGVAIGPELAHVGLEVRGDPGLFVGIGDWQWAQGQR